MMENLSPPIRDFEGLSITVVGDLILDQFLWGDVERISPEAPVPVVQISRESYRLGGAANVALNLASLGARPLLSGVVGDDSWGRVFLKAMEDEGLETDGIVVQPELTTTVKTRIIAHRQQVCRADREARGALSSESRRKVSDKTRAFLEASRGLILSDYAKGVLDESTCQQLIGRAGEAGVVSAADPKPEQFHFYRGASLVTPNLKEAETAAGRVAAGRQELEELGRQLQSAFQLENLLITRGAEGMSLFEGPKIVHLPTVARDVFDVTGAGDTVIAVIVLAAAAAVPLSEAADLANHAAGVVVGKVGTATVTPEELEASLES